MIFSVIDDRLPIVKELSERNALREEEPWRIEASLFRFTIEDLHGDLKLPYVIGAKDLITFKRALLELSFYIKKRIEGRDPRELNKLFASQLPGHIQELPPMSYRPLSLQREDALSEDVITSLMFYVPILDSGILRVWFSKKGEGCSLIKSLKAIYSKSLKEEVQLSGREKTLFLAHMSILNSLRRVKEVIKGIDIKGIGYEKWEYYIGIILYLILKGVIEDSLSALKKTFPLYEIEKTEMILKSTLTPGSFLYIKDGLCKNPISLYGINCDIINNLSPIYDGLNRDEMDLELVKDELDGRVRGNGSFEESVRMIRRLRTFKAELLRYFSTLDVLKGKENRDLLNLMRSEKLLLKLFSDDRYNREIRKTIEDISRSFSQDRERVLLMEGLQEAIDRSAGWFTRFGLKKTMEKEDIKKAIDCFLVYRFDQDLEKRLLPWQNFLRDMREELNDKEIKRDYEKGRLYRFSSDERPSLMKPKVTKEGYLFIDMKDFTRKTLRTKEVAMADFMKARFFQPIIDAASIYGLGRDMAEEGIGVRLNNLLGDAMIFSGGVSSLVYLAEDIQTIIDRYRVELTENLSSRVLDRVIENIRTTYKDLKKNITAKKDISRGETLIDLMKEERGLEDAFKDEIEEIEKKGMMAGLFISFGTKAEQVHLKSDLWGDINVAIGGKINEAARGVSRNSMVKARLTALLERRRRQLNKPFLTLPFSVYIGRAYSVVIDPHIAYKIEESLINRGSDKVLDLTREVTRMIYNDLKVAIEQGSFASLKVLVPVKEIYNIGHAISEEALKAYIEETKASTLHFSKRVAVRDLSREIIDRFLFLEESLNLLISVKRGAQGDRVLVFRLVGDVAFKGFELGGSTIVYEILKRDSDFYQLLLKHHLKEWIAQAFEKRCPSGFH